MPSEKQSSIDQRVNNRVKFRQSMSFLRTRVVMALLAMSAWAIASANEPSGEAIYREMCANCHGPKGEGVADKYDEPLYGDRSLKSLTRLIDRTMPENDADKLDAAGAAKVAEYIYGAFYSPAARAKVVPPRIDPARLTVTQYENTLADLISASRGKPPVAVAGEQKEMGLKAEYYNARSFNGDKKAFERVDPYIDFSFGEGSPSADTNQIGVAEFSIKWRGSIIVDETGDYEFSIRTENGARLFVNNDKDPLIDGWVSSGNEPREEKATIRLLGGRAYPFMLNFFKYKEKTASITVQWKAPHKTWEVIPARHLSTRGVQESFVVTTAFPADDGSAGYERGTTVSKAWDLAATHGAIQAADYIVEHADQFANVPRREGLKRPEKKEGQPDPPPPTAEELEKERISILEHNKLRREKLMEFSKVFVSRAFRRDLADEEKAAFVEGQFEEATEPLQQDLALKRVVLRALKSPRFLYPELEDGTVDQFDTASRLSYVIWDAPLDKQLWDAAHEQKLGTLEEITAQARRMMKDPRARTKMRGFFHHWLKMEEAADVSKDPKSFPDFSDYILADLRTSLELFLDEVVWSEQSDYRQLLLAEHLPLNERLTRFYAPGKVTEAPKEATSGEQSCAPEAGQGVSQVVGLRQHSNEFRKVEFTKERAGVLTHPYLLTAFSYYKSSSPIHRGVFLTRNIVGRALKPPPMAIQFMDGRFDAKMTMREKVTELTSPAACQGCHTIINPLGFSLENFDGVGRYRTHENEKPIDPTSDYLASDGEMVRLKSARDVAEYAASNEDAQRGFVRQLFQHLAKQPAQAYGTGTLAALRDKFEQENFNTQKLIAEIALVAARHSGGNGSGQGGN